MTAFRAARGAAVTASATAALNRVRELRARILYDSGRRPAFRDSDVQDLDFGAWHFVARRTPDGPPLGYVRLCPPALTPLFQTRAFLGAERYEAILRAEGLTGVPVFEHSRLVVEHHARRQGLGTYLNAQAIGAAHALGARAMVGTSGTADGQDTFHRRFGFRPVPGTRRYVDHYTEDVVILLHRVSQGAGDHTALVADLSARFRHLTHPAPAPREGEPPFRAAGRSAGRPPSASRMYEAPGRTAWAASPGAVGLGSAQSPRAAVRPRSSEVDAGAGEVQPCSGGGAWGSEPVPAAWTPSARRASATAARTPVEGTPSAEGGLSLASAAPAWAGRTSGEPGVGRRRVAPVGLVADVPGGEWRPVVFDPVRQADVRGLGRLLRSGRVWEVCDTIDEQLTELVTCWEPALRRDPAGLAAAKRRRLGGLAAWEYGTWVFYPWSGRLVHVLPKEEFRQVRTDRNRGRIERLEQRSLLSRRIGVIGLSVGNCVALTLVLEGIGGAFKLADFDALGLSNLNRLRGGIHSLGINKAVLAAREMFEIDPYLDIEIYPDGLTDQCMSEFFSEGNGPIDLLVEECDTPYVKIAARERARALGVPVVMDANDRGLLDVERFDLEPDRPLLHGRLGDIASEDLRELSQEERVELIVAMVDGERISPQLAASIPRLGTSLSSWPQLASGVALGGALCADAARRILLGAECASGRYYTDLDVLLAAGRSTVPCRA